MTNEVDNFKKLMESLGDEENYVTQKVEEDADDELAQLMKMAGLDRDNFSSALDEPKDNRYKDMDQDTLDMEEAVGDAAAPIHDLIDELGSHQLVLDELIRYLDVDQIADFVSDFRRHHDM